MSDSDEFNSKRKVETNNFEHEMCWYISTKIRSKFPCWFLDNKMLSKRPIEECFYSHVIDEGLHLQASKRCWVGGVGSSAIDLARRFQLAKKIVFCGLTRLELS